MNKMYIKNQLMYLPKRPKLECFTQMRHKRATIKLSKIH